MAYCLAIAAFVVQFVAAEGFRTTVEATVSIVSRSEHRTLQQGNRSSNCLLTSFHKLEAQACTYRGDRDMQTQFVQYEPLASSTDDSCRYHNDGECDEPNYCAAGTDCSDCNTCGAHAPRRKIFCVACPCHSVQCECTS